MNCPWIKSANPNDRLSKACDLVGRRVLCSGLQEHCEYPRELADEKEKALLAECDEHALWLDMVDAERYIRAR